MHSTGKITNEIYEGENLSILMIDDRNRVGSIDDGALITSDANQRVLLEL